jgi:hypothetical protein
VIKQPLLLILCLLTMADPSVPSLSLSLSVHDMKLPIDCGVSSMISASSALLTS